MPAIAHPVGVEVGLAYAIVGPDGTRAVINDPDDADFIGYTNADSGVTGLERAGVRENADTLPEADGGVHGAFHYDRLTFTLQGIIPPDSPPAASDDWVGRQDRLMRATDAMRSDSYLYWTPSATDAIPLRLAFRQQQPTRITGRRPKSFLVAGVAERNVVEAADVSIVTIAPTADSLSGFSSPLRSLLTSAPAAPTGAIVTNRGRSAAWPVITIYGPCSAPVVLNATTGQALVFGYALGDGDYLTVDTNPSRRSIRLNDQANRYSALDFARSSWWPLVPGANDVRIGFGTFSAGAHVDVTYRDAWG